MRRRPGWIWRGLATSVCLVVVAGCSSGPDDGGGEKERPAPSATAPSAAGVRTNLWRSPVIRREAAATGDAGPLLYDGRFYVRPDPAGKAVLTVVDTRTSAVLVRHQAAHADEGWHVEDAYLTGGFLVVVDADPEPPYQPTPWFSVSAYRLSGATGMVSARPLATGADGPALSKMVPEVFAAGGRFAYTTEQGGKTCVAVGDVSTGRATVRYCPPAGWLPGYLRMDATTLTFTENAHDAALTKAVVGCRRLVRLPLSSGSKAPVAVPADRPCRQYAGAGGDGWSVWTDAASTDVDPERALIMARAGAGPSVRLDEGTTGSVRSCGAWVYYNHRVDPGTVELRRWRPGASVESVYRSPSDEVSATSNAFCADGWVSVMRQYTGSGAGYTELVAATGT